MIIQLVIGLVFVSSSYGRSDIEVKGWFFSLAVECNKIHTIETEELMMLQQHKIPNSDNAKCLMACIYKKANLMDEKGNYDLTKTNEWIATEFGDDPTRLEKAKSLFDFCKTVNDQADDEKGCERAYLLSKCLTENVPKVGFELD